MLSTSNKDIVETLQLFKSVNLPVSFIVPTITGMEKSIMDATFEVREFLRQSGLHDYSSQEQGQENKNILQTKLLSNDAIYETTTSLYRPETKNGDPRIWIYELKKYANPTDLLALIANRDELIIINCSRSNLSEILSASNPVFKDLLSALKVGMSEIAEELFEKMRDISKLGFVQTKRPGDTGVGYTLETLLGIQANSSQTPDYKGIEIKSGRISSHQKGRTTLFSQVPNWRISNLKSSKDLLHKRGRFNEEKQRIQLFHELSVIKANSFDLQLETDLPGDSLHQIYVGGIEIERDVTWEFEILKQRLLDKHKETFWVTAQTEGRSGDADEKFWYSSLKHTGKVDGLAFPILLESGSITLDYTIKETSSGGAKDQGYLFKISSKNLNLLFTTVEEYQLNGS